MTWSAAQSQTQSLEGGGRSAELTFPEVRSGAARQDSNLRPTEPNRFNRRGGERAADNPASSGCSQRGGLASPINSSSGSGFGASPATRMWSLSGERTNIAIAPSPSSVRPCESLLKPSITAP
jgi:hypothetical protein